MIDLHTHIFFDDVKRDRENFFNDANFNMLYNSDKAKIFSIEDISSYKDEYEISKILCFGFAWNEEKYNNLQKEYLKKQMHLKEKGFYFSSCVVKGDVFSQIKKCKEDGFSAIGELAFYDGDVDFSFLDEVFSCAAQFKMPVFLHVNDPVGHNYTGKYLTNFTELYNVIKNNPDTVIVLCHLGGGLFIYENLKEVKDAFKNVYYDIAALPFLYDEKIVGIANEVCKNKILFGTDFPLLNISRYQKQIKVEEFNVLQENSLNFCNTFLK